MRAGNHHAVPLMADALDFPAAQRRLPDALQSDLHRFVALLQRWQTAHNLVSRGSLDDLWTRHIRDSLQLVKDAPPFRRWVDLGSGAGFPGLIVALAFKEDASRHFFLIEASQKKAAFLRAAIRETSARAEVVAERIERYGASMDGKADVISARALAPLPRLLELAHPCMHEGSALLLLKGREFPAEEAEAAKAWDYDLTKRSSDTDPQGIVAMVRKLRRKLSA
jgi:16S rRNA (guanine527-N7)-methyltransferase